MYARSFLLQHQNTDPFSGKTLAEKYKENEYGSESTIQTIDDGRDGQDIRT